LGTDLQQQKMTLPLIHLLEQGGALGKRARQLLSHPDEDQRQGLRVCLREAGSLDYARLRAVDLANRARKELHCVPPSPYRTILDAMAERVVHRDH